MLLKKSFFLKGDTDARSRRSGKMSVALIVNWSLSMNFLCFILHTFLHACTHVRTQSVLPSPVHCKAKKQGSSQEDWAPPAINLGTLNTNPPTKEQASLGKCLRQQLYKISLEYLIKPKDQMQHQRHLIRVMPKGLMSHVSSHVCVGSVYRFPLSKCLFSYCPASSHRIKVGLGNLQHFLALEFYESISAFFWRHRKKSKYSWVLAHVPPPPRYLICAVGTKTYLVSVSISFWRFLLKLSI